MFCGWCTNIFNLLVEEKIEEISFCFHFRESFSTSSPTVTNVQALPARLYCSVVVWVSLVRYSFAAGPSFSFFCPDISMHEWGLSGQVSWQAQPSGPRIRLPRTRDASHVQSVRERLHDLVRAQFSSAGPRGQNLHVSSVWL